MERIGSVLFLCFMLLWPKPAWADQTTTELEESLRAVETAFAKTMADRDLEAFATFIAEDAVFSTSRQVLRGRSEIVEGWSSLFEGPDAPFSWRPERVHVLEDGSMGGTAGPVIDAAGNTVGYFVSTWIRRNGAWRVILDQGVAPDCP